MSTAHHDQLRARAAGSYPLTAATELLIRSFDGRFAAPGCPWVHRESGGGEYRIDFWSIPDHLQGLSSGERALVLLAASLSDAAVPVDLGDLIPRLDRELLGLVLAAVASAGGGDSHPALVETDDGTPELVILPPLFPWPGEAWEDPHGAG